MSAREPRRFDTAVDPTAPRGTTPESRGRLRRALRSSGIMLIRPWRGVGAVISDPDCLWTGLWIGVLFLAAYALTALIYALLGHQPVARRRRL